MASSNDEFKEYCYELKREFNLNNQLLFVKGPELNLDSFDLSAARNRCYYCYPPTGFQYLLQAIEGKSVQPSILNLNFEVLKRVSLDPSFEIRNWLSILHNYLQENNPSIIGVSNMFTMYQPDFLKILNSLKTHNGIILAGGQNPTYLAEQLLEEDLCHFVLQREAENKLNYLLDNFIGDREGEPVPDIMFKFGGQIKKTEGKKDVVSLNGNLIKSYKHVALEEYCKFGSLSPFSRMIGKEVPFATISFNRGCEANCKFCGTSEYMGRGVRSREIQDVVDEIVYLHDEKGVRFFEWLDDDFSRHKDRTIELLTKLSERNLGIKWASTNGFIAKTLDEEVLAKMRDSGCVGFHVGIESGNPEVLRNMRKPGTLRTFREFSERAQKFPEMFIADNYILGFPGETFSDLMDSYHFALEMNLDWSFPAMYQPDFETGGVKKDKKEGPQEDYVPTREKAGGKLVSSSEILTGLKLFTLPQDAIPSREQLKHIWFAFNLAKNFVKNKNLLPGGRPEKFISWTEPIQERYPTQAYISLYLSLAHLLNNNPERADEYRKKTLDTLEDPYWRKTLEDYGFSSIITDFPRNKREAETAIFRVISLYP